VNVRVIPRLDIKGPSLVKGIQLEGLRVLGRPEEFARHYYAQGADELLYMDIVASLYQRDSILRIVERTSRAVFVPLTVGGGLRSIEDMRAVLSAGADKVALNSAVVRRPELISEAANLFGSSTVVVSIEAQRRGAAYEAYVDSGRERTGRDVFAWAVRAVGLGAGEILVTAIDRDGGGKGYDIELTRRVADLVSVPVIAGGGCGGLDHVAEAIEHGHADAVCVASMFHYAYLARRDAACAAPATAPGLPPALGATTRFSRVRPADPSVLRKFLARRGVECLCSRSHLSAGERLCDPS
jgi:cyclase